MARSSAENKCVDNTLVYQRLRNGRGPVKEFLWTEESTHRGLTRPFIKSTPLHLSTLLGVGGVQWKERQIRSPRPAPGLNSGMNSSLVKFTSEVRGLALTCTWWLQAKILGAVLTISYEFSLKLACVTMLESAPPLSL